jgi:hypothetical protein
MCRTASLVEASTTGAATPSAKARAQFTAVTHQRSPGTSPGKRYCGLGVVVADAALVVQELGGDHGTDRVASEVFRAGAAAAVPEEPGHRVGTAWFEIDTEDVALHHGPIIAPRWPLSSYVPIDRSAAGCTLRPAHRSRATGARTRAAINESTRASSADRTPRRREATILSRELASSRSSGCGAS